MQPWVQHAAEPTPDGTVLTLWQRGQEWVIRAGTLELMSSRQRGSEEELARLARPQAPSPRILVGGLGMGFTLRAALDGLPDGGRCVVAELSDAVVAWNRGPLGPLALHPLDDPRVELVVGDVAGVIAKSEGRFDAILLDVDNGPEGLTQAQNHQLYGNRGLAASFRALTPGGALAVWSLHQDPAFEERLQRAGFGVAVHRVKARPGAAKAKHVVVVGRKG